MKTRKKAAPPIKPEEIKEKLFQANWQSFGGTSFGYYDAFRGQKEPTKAELVRAFDDIVYTAAQLIASNFVTAKVRLYVKTGRGQAQPKCDTRSLSKKTLEGIHKTKALSYDTSIAEVVEHPLLDLLDKVNPFHNRLDLFELTQLFLDVTGNSFWLVVTDDFNLPQEVYLLPSQNMEPERDEALAVKAWKYHQGNKTTCYDPKEIIHFKYANLQDPYGEGYSPVRAAWQRIQIGWKELGYLDNTLSNNARPDAILSPQNEISPFEAERLAKDFGHRFRASGNGGIFVADGPMKLDTLNWPPKDLAELELYKVVKTSVLNAFHIPPELFEIGEANRSTAEAALYSLAVHCLKPRVTRFVEKLNERLVPYYDDRLFFCADEVVPEDKDFDLRERDMLLKNGVITRGEGRKLYGFDPEEWASEPLIPSGMLPTASPEAEAPVEQAPLVQQGPDPAQVSQQVLTLQEAYYNGQLPREAVLAQAVLLMKLPREDAEALFPEKAPVKLTPDEGPKVEAPEQAPKAPELPPQKARVKAVLDVPDVRQQGDADCGAAATMAVCRFFNVGPDNEAAYAEALGTSEEEGTRPEAITSYLEQVGLKAEAKQGLTLEELASLNEAGKPVIVPIQEDGSGHYVIVCGIEGDKVTLQDPLAGKVEVKANDFLRNWHDGNPEGTYSRYGIAVGRGKASKGTTRKALLKPLPEASPAPLVKALEAFFSKQKAELLGSQKAIEGKALPEHGFFDLARWTDEMFAAMIPHVQLYYDHAAKQTVTSLGADAELLRVVQPGLRQAVAEATMLFCQSTNEATSKSLDSALDELRKQIAEGLEVGDVKNAMKDRVQSVFEGLGNERAYQIGHTEASRAQHNAMMITARESGVAKAKRWFLSSDACPECKPLAGKTVGLDEAFDTRGEGPYAEITSPPLHPLCRCAMALVVDKGEE